MTDYKTVIIGVFLTVISVCTLLISLIQIAVGGVYFDQCPAKSIMPIFIVVSGAVGIVAGVLFLITGLLHVKGKDGNICAIVSLIAGSIIYAIFIPWYMYGGTLTSVGRSANSRQSTDPNTKSTYCISHIQRIIDGIFLLYWISVVIFIICLLIFIVMRR